ncbi:MAG TPA: ACP S-malonyltransferase, partial [Gemmatimonadaceae bacterium]|nr:ACP S-malonyltransferase [Gemmatimonadaceae bacterium]
MEIILVFPGQGSQKPGMARDLVEAFPSAHMALADADEVTPHGSASLASLMFDGPADELTLTHNAQPALLAHGAALWSVLRDAVAPHVRAAAGHSLGEFTAYHAAGALRLRDALTLVRRRGELMYRTGTERPGTMAAVLGTLTRSVDDICREASAAGIVVPANYNTDEQVVISGEIAAVERAMEIAKTSGAKRAMRLQVSGAFHSPLMQPAAEGLGAALAAARWREPAFPVYSNVDAVPNSSGASATDLLVRQLTSPVRWVESVRRMAADLPGALFVELGPGNVLAGLIKRIVPNAETFACGTAADVRTLLSRLSA